ILGVDMQVNETGASHCTVLRRCPQPGHQPSRQFTVQTTSRLAISIQASTPPVNPTSPTIAIASFTNPSIPTSVVAIVFLYVRSLFWSSNKRVTVNRRLTHRPLASQAASSPTRYGGSD